MQPSYIVAQLAIVTEQVYAKENLSELMVFNPAVNFLFFNIKWFVYNATHTFFIMVSFRDFLVNISLICPHTWMNWSLRLPCSTQSEIEGNKLKCVCRGLEHSTSRKNLGEFTVFTSLSFLKNFPAYENADTSKTINNSVCVYPKLSTVKQLDLISSKNIFWIEWDK